MVDRFTVESITRQARRNGAYVAQLLAADSAQWARLYRDDAPAQAIAYQREAAAHYQQARRMLGIEEGGHAVRVT